MNQIEKILFDITFYVDPNLLKNPGKYLLEGIELDKKRLRRYLKMISDINWIFRKIQKYELFFDKFYSEDIKNHEALEHHIHAYLQDMNILKEKLKYLLDILKQDIVKIASNKSEIKADLQAITKEVVKVFDDVKKHRNPHTHVCGKRFLDGDLLNVEIADAVLNNNPLLEELKPEAIEYYKAQLLDSFSMSKEHWIEQAKTNNEQILGLLETLFGGIQATLYQYLQIKSVSQSILEDK